MTATAPGRLRVYNGGFARRRIRRILQLVGWQIRTGWPRDGDAVGVWGHAPTAWRGERVARQSGAPLVRIEDAFLRSLHPGRAGEAPLGVMIDTTGGAHYDPRRPSTLERMLARDPLDDTAILDRARTAIDRIRRLHLTKYAAVLPDLGMPEPGYVLVIDQTRGDASVRLSNADADRFREMLAFARIENPGARIVIKTHPETAGGHRAGHLSASDLDPRTIFFDAPASPWALLEGAVAVYAVSSQMGFEAILAGHRPRIFGQPFYAGWGLTQDETPVARRERRLTRAQLVAAALIEHPTWYDPFEDRLCALEEVIDTLEAQARAWREDRHGYVACGMRLWKRRPMQAFFGGVRPLRFADTGAAARLAADLDRPVLVWAGKAAGDLSAPWVFRVEDGFLRSRGLGADLVPPLSLVRDATGIYYDPAAPSDLETLIAQSPDLPIDEIERGRRLIAYLIAQNLTKYNIRGALPPLPTGRRILVPGQVEDDASIRLGCGAVATNAALLNAAREANPDAVLIYKPHPDVEAGLRPGKITAGAADIVATQADPAALLAQVQEVWTMTSALGFEALLRGVPVTCLGMPFYAGWGLTRDLMPAPPRRGPGPTLEGLAHAALIGYPRYRDPVTGLPCPVEVVARRLGHGPLPRPGPGNRALAKLQGAFAGQAHLWRRG
ncbi:capsular polysaccharide biosynthesis protein [Palleronia sediminis]|uniref:capsular polysaccharide biosynthesis protein n=1 Tax=Palleronia sediminis TaxID=2547833 RepID=UPI001F0DAC83|nr:capsular polysaccharide biosynthesis protein [Palleronia sediminis]